uniref:Uncharacterized protein n=1 Tax=Tanacetum cinerariifolium TaxID=118510 RepID=A0A6L2P3F8_TANCI|nr:hypothetical protein [Tanacetum cinerariifolium]
MFNEYVNGENEVVSESSIVSNKQQHTTQSTLTTVDAESPHLIIHTTSDPSTLTSHVNVKDNQNDQENDTQFDVYEFINPFSPEIIHCLPGKRQECVSQWSSERRSVKCKYVTRNTGKGPKNEENTDSYEALRHNPYDSVTSNIFKVESSESALRRNVVT